MAATAAGRPAERLVAKNNEARKSELSTADFQFQRWTRYFTGSRSSRRNARLTVRAWAVVTCRMERVAAVAHGCEAEGSTRQCTVRSRDGLLRQHSPFFNFP